MDAKGRDLEDSTEDNEGNEGSKGKYGEGKMPKSRTKDEDEHLTGERRETQSYLRSVCSGKGLPILLRKNPVLCAF